MKILIISPKWIGDIVISHSLYQLIFIKYQSQVQIDIIVPKQYKSIINRMPEIHKILTTSYKHRVIELKQYYNLKNLLKNQKYQQAIILPNSLKSSVVPFLSNIPIRTGWRGEMRYGLLNDLRILNESALPLLVQRYAALAYDKNVIQHFYDLPNPLPLPCFHVSKIEITNILIKFNLNQNKTKLIALCPGSASNLSKRWPHYHYITLATQLILMGYHIIILGSSQEFLLKNLFQNSILKKFQNNHHNLIGCTSLNETIIILAACKVIVSNDSGLLHIACALKRPALGVYGPSEPIFTPPLFYKSKIIYNNSNKNQTTTHLINDLYGYHESLIKTTPNQVLIALKILLK